MTGSTPTRTARSKGETALLADIAAFHERGTRVELTSGVDAHGRHFRFAWATRDAAGAVVKEGLDVGQLADDGRISRSRRSTARLCKPPLAAPVTELIPVWRTVCTTNRSPTGWASARSN